MQYDFVRRQMKARLGTRLSIKPACANFSRNSHSVVPSGMSSSNSSPRNRVNDIRSRTWRLDDRQGSVLFEIEEA